MIEGSFEDLLQLQQFVYLRTACDVCHVRDVYVGRLRRVSPFIGFLKHREEQMARRQETMDAVCSGFWRGGYEIALEGEEDEVSWRALAGRIDGAKVVSHHRKERSKLRNKFHEKLWRHLLFCVVN